MPNDLEISINTTAELSGAEAAATQLERDIADARALGAAFDDAAAQLQKLHQAIIAFTGNNPSAAPAQNPPASVPVSAPAAPRYESSPDPGAAVAARAVQSSADKLRASLQENTRLTVALFNQAFDLLQEQNRGLAAMNRRVTELSGQLANLKNNQ